MKIIFTFICRIVFLGVHSKFVVVTEPQEDRMEQALFSPPLSKQQVEYAVQHIRQSCAATMVNEPFVASNFSLSNVKH